MTYELVFEKYISEPEYEFDDCRRVVRIYVHTEDLSADIGFDAADLHESVRLLLAFSKGLTFNPAGYHFCCFGIHKEDL